MSLREESFQYQGEEYRVREAPMSFILPLVEAGEHARILPEILKSFTLKRNGDGEFRPLGDAVLDEFGMKGYKALMLVAQSLNGLDVDGKESEEPGGDEAPDEGNP